MKNFNLILLSLVLLGAYSPSFGQSAFPFCPTPQNLHCKDSNGAPVCVSNATSCSSVNPSYTSWDSTPRAVAGTATNPVQSNSPQVLPGNGSLSANWQTTTSQPINYPNTPPQFKSTVTPNGNPTATNLAASGGSEQRNLANAQRRENQNKEKSSSGEDGVKPGESQFESAEEVEARMKLKDKSSNCDNIDCSGATAGDNNYGRKVKYTEAGNQAIKATDDQVRTSIDNSTEVRLSAEQAALAAKRERTDKDALESQARMLDISAGDDKRKGLNTSISTVAGYSALAASHSASAALLKGVAEEAHKKAKKEFHDNYEAARASADENCFVDPSTGKMRDAAECKKNKADMQAATTNYEDVKDAIDSNKKAESAVQLEMVARETNLVQQAVAVATEDLKTAKLKKLQADKLRQLAAEHAAQGGYSFIGSNPNTLASTAAPGAAVIQPDSVADGPGTAEAPTGPAPDPINPNLTDPNANAGPPATAFNGAPIAPGAAGGNLGMGGAGGTSAAKEDGGKDQGSPAKSQAGGLYANDGTGFRPRGGGSGSPSVGADKGFLDMFKGILQGGEKDKPVAAINEPGHDRMPAGDSAAVLGRNQDIFKAIRDRYAKEHGKGNI